MRITIESTETIVHFNGSPARVWQGTTEKGVPCLILTSQLCIPLTHDTSEADRDLRTSNKPVIIPREQCHDFSAVLAEFYDKVRDGIEPHAPIMLPEVHDITLLLLRFVTGGDAEAKASIDYLVDRGLARYEGTGIRLSSSAEELLKEVK